MFWLRADEKKFLLGYSPKCACASVKTWFLRATNMGLPEDDIHALQFPSLSPTKAQNNEAYTDFRKFIVIRDPYKRLVSGYINFYVMHKDPVEYWDNFSDFIARIVREPAFATIDSFHFMPQTKPHHLDIKPEDIEFSLNVDTLEKDLQKLNKAIGVNPGSIPISNSTPYSKKTSFSKPAWEMSYEEIRKDLPGYRHFYNEEIVAQVQEAYEMDFNFFKKLGYDFKLPA